MIQIKLADGTPAFLNPAHIVWMVGTDEGCEVTTTAGLLRLQSTEEEVLIAIEKLQDQ